MNMLASRNSSLDRREDISPTKIDVGKIKTLDEAYELLYRSIPQSDIGKLIFRKLLKILKKCLSTAKTREEVLGMLRKAPDGLYGLVIRPIIKKRLGELPPILKIVR